MINNKGLIILEHLCYIICDRTIKQLGLENIYPHEDVEQEDRAILRERCYDFTSLETYVSHTQKAAYYFVIERFSSEQRGLIFLDETGGT